MIFIILMANFRRHSLQLSPKLEFFFDRNKTQGIVNRRLREFKDG